MPKKIIEQNLPVVGLKISAEIRSKKLLLQ